MEARPPVAEVTSLELRLLDPDARRNPGELDRLLAEDFTEVGASGRRWDRASMIASLTAKPGLAVEVRDMIARSVGEGVVLFTYVAEYAADAGTNSFRTSLWVRSQEGWRLLFHQGDAHRGV